MFKTQTIKLNLCEAEVAKFANDQLLHSTENVPLFGSQRMINQRGAFEGLKISLRN